MPIVDHNHMGVGGTRVRDQPALTALHPVAAGAAVTFDNNCINNLLTCDSVPAVIRLLQALHERVGPNRQRDIDAVLSGLKGALAHQPRHRLTPWQQPTQPCRLRQRVQ